MQGSGDGVIAAGRAGATDDTPPGSVVYRFFLQSTIKKTSVRSLPSDSFLTLSKMSKILKKGSINWSLRINNVIYNI